MADMRMIVEFFKREAPSIGITEEFLHNPSVKIDELIQAYNFLCDLIFEDMDFASADTNDRATEVALLARPNLMIKTREAVNLVFNSIYDGRDEFCYTDLLQPDSRRTRNFLAQMIRFFNFKCEIAKEVVRVDNEIEDRCREINFEKQLDVKTKEQLNHEKEQLAEIESKKHALQQTELDFRQKLDMVKGKKESERKVYENHEERLHEIDDRIEAQKQKIVELEDAGRRLEMNIVSSPDRIIRELEQLTLEKTNLQTKLDNASQESRKLEREMAEYTMVGQCMGGFMEEMKKLEVVQDKILQLRPIEDKYKLEIKELELQKKLSLQELEHLEKKYKSDLENLKREVQTSRKEIEAIQQQNAHLESDEKEMADRLLKVKANIREHQKKLKHKERMFTIITDVFEDAVKKMMNQCNDLKNKVDNQQEALNKIVEKTISIYGLN